MCGEGSSFQEHINCTYLDAPVLSELLLSSYSTLLSLRLRYVYEKSVCSFVAALILLLPHSNIILSAANVVWQLCACFTLCNLEPREYKSPCL